ncbi:hypothetical protein AAGQ96_02145 [Pantoea sp. MBD-2R]|uniref:hypothetical protein n=1 Tax=unclassified Pantoea TaxID=2630326 RepID=UPI0011BD9C55|nr:hypothetical protein [Pantoea sp. CCBC3-3-1]
MKTIAIATLLGIVLSTSALASTTGCAQQVKSSTSKAANSYVYINRIASPIDGTAFIEPSIAAEKLATQL